MKRPLALAFAIALLSISAVAQDATDPTSSPPIPCGSEEYRHFDFWIGEWEVKDANGSLQGHNTIESILGGCVLKENWEGASGSIGESYNTYDRQTGQWHQTWVDASGTLLRIDGGIQDGKMVLKGEWQGQNGPAQHRISWEPRSDGTVRQLWESSQDGAQWNVLFDGIYSPK